MGDRVLPYRTLIKILRAYGVSVSDVRGKGSHRMLCRVVEGQKLTYPVTFHGNNRDTGRGLVSSIRRGLRLTPENGVTDEAFYAHA